MNLDTIIPDHIQDGVYAGYLIDAETISIGTNPTFNGQTRKVEAFVLDRTDLDLYGHHVEIQLVKEIRDQIKFDSIEEDVLLIRSVL